MDVKNDFPQWAWGWTLAIGVAVSATPSSQAQPTTSAAAGSKASPAPSSPAASAPAAAMYRITLPDGRVILTDRPPEKTPGLPGNAKVEPLRRAPPPSPEAQAAAQQRLQADKAANEEARRQRQANSAADARRDAAIAAAQQRLADAESRAQAASTPREGDFTPIAGGGTRLNEAYHARQAKAAADVAAARAALDAALQR